MENNQSWEQQCQEIQAACSSNNWRQVIQECNELIQFAQQQAEHGAAMSTQGDAQGEQEQQLHIQAHAEQDFS